MSNIRRVVVYINDSSSEHNKEGHKESRISCGRSENECRQTETYGVFSSERLGITRKTVGVEDHNRNSWAGAKIQIHASQELSENRLTRYYFDGLVMNLKN